MRVVMVSKALVVAAYQRKAEEIARLGIELTVLVPPGWRDSRGQHVAAPPTADTYRFQIVPVRLNGHFHLHYYPTLARVLACIQPDVLHMDEEPYNLATWLGLRSAQRLGIAGTFFTWQNLYRRYPPPFRWFEQANYRAAPRAIAGNREAAEILRRKGYTGVVEVIPQFGVDPALFAPASAQTKHASDKGNLLRIGYAGGLIPEKGVDLLLRACARLDGDWQLHLAGEGSERAALARLALDLDIGERVHFHGRLESLAMPGFYHTLDLFVLPSRTLPTWKEQFGRVLVEAMSSGVAVIGSDSGEIPSVVGAAGLIFAEGNEDALYRSLQELLKNPEQRRALAAAGRQRVLDRYTMAQVARETVAVYEKLCTLR